MNIIDDSALIIDYYLTAAGAHVTITEYPIGPGGLRVADPADTTRGVFDVACEACGFLRCTDRDRHYFRRADDADDPARAGALTHAGSDANKHAAACRRLPKHLWPQGGAR